MYLPGTMSCKRQEACDPAIVLCRSLKSNLEICTEGQSFERVRRGSGQIFSALQIDLQVRRFESVTSFLRDVL